MAQHANHRANGIREQIKTLNQTLSVVSRTLIRDRAAVDVLKEDVARELKNAEMALHLSHLAGGAPMDYTSSAAYFEALVAGFGEKMRTCQVLIEEIDSCLSALSSPARLTPATLSSLLRSQHDSFIALAAQVAELHERVVAARDATIRLLGRDPFAARRRAKDLQGACGPSLYSSPLACDGSSRRSFTHAPAQNNAPPCYGRHWLRDRCSRLWQRRV